MAPEETNMASQIKAATRMELLNTKKKIKLATKGHKLLKEKRDALISEFFKLIDGLKNTRKKLEAQLAIAYRSLILSQATLGIEEVKLAANASESLPNIVSKQKTIMGVKVPQFEIPNLDIKQGYSQVSTSMDLDTAANNFKEVILILIKLAEIEATAILLAEEIKKTKRKVNALERILIPNLHKDVSYIKMRLEEMERENFSRLKIIKKRIEA